MIGAKSARAERFWRALREADGIDAVAYHASTFADPALSQNVDKFGDLAVSGQTRATAHSALDIERGGYWVVLNAAQEPICLVRVAEVDVGPFEDVGEATAIAEGEGDLGLAHRATVHRRSFEKRCSRWGIGWREDLPTVCEYFDLIWPDPQAP